METQTTTVEPLLSDPRTDLSSDSALWRYLFSLTQGDAKEPEGLFGALRGMRSSGCRLVSVGGKVVIRAGDEWGDSPEGKGYEYYRDKYLAPHRESLVAALNELIGDAPPVLVAALHEIEAA